ncbi:C2 domain containing protein [Oryctes borbonicus]|uniref:C2 domain containing protein n=1 Tax=Oryctes borbonicus TaxID=1629725 RepID=A0A0T6BH20_9SCAR|nr:C2 domain containing protein [Oryctes borbonicus]
MSLKLDKLKNFFSTTQLDGPTSKADLQPEVGFKLTYFEQTKQLVVKVIGARHLPSTYGTQKPEGYLIKVRVYPAKEKYETEIVKQSWPTFNQELTFDLTSNADSLKDQFLGKFVTLTVYAILESSNKGANVRRAKSMRNSFRFLVGKEENVEIRKSSKSRQSASRFTFDNRRTIGAVTYNLDPKKFNQKRYLTHATPDIWREIQNISSGIDFEKKESACNVEVVLSYFNSEDGNNDRIEISLSKLRCSMVSMHEQERLGGSIYLKITAFEYGVRVGSWKSDRFQPTISMKIDPLTATLQVLFRNYNLRNIKIVIRLVSKNMIGKKILIGKIEIDNDSAIFKEAIDSPSNYIIKSLELESPR